MTAEFSRRFDMRWIKRRDFETALRHAEDEAVARFGGPVTRDLTSENHFMVATFRPASGVVGLAEFEGSLVKAVDEINQENNQSMANVTSAKDLGEQFRTALAGIKSKLAKTAEDARRSFGELEDTANLAAETVKQVERESADLKAALGLSTNNPPAGAK